MVGNKPVLIVVAGPNGSGKTTITKQLLQHAWMDGCVYINPDEIAQNHFQGWNDSSSIFEAAVFAEELRNQCLADARSLAFETVFSATDKVRFIQEAQKRGFFIRLFFVCTSDPNINAARVAQRVREGGHGVPIDKIISRYYKSIANCVAVAPHVDRLYFYDNSVDNKQARLLFKVKDGIVSKIYEDLEPWSRDILKTIPQNK